MSLHSACFQEVLENKMADASSWFYRGEGNDTLVIGLRDHNIVLRLKKKPRNVQNGHYETIYSSNLEDINKLLDFSKYVFLPLMDGSYVPIGQAVRLPEGFANKLEDMCEPYRPKHRLHKGIDTRAPFAMAMPDLCFLPKEINCKSHTSLNRVDNSKPTFSVEIKPKCGFLPSSSYITKDHSVRTSVCYYCMLQELKVAEGKYTRKSCYCPVNLLSGDPQRMIYALESLVLDPQNNLRVFKDGFPIYTEELVQGEFSTTDGGLCCSSHVFEKVLKEAGWTRRTNDANGAHTSHKSLGPYSMGFLQTILQILQDDSKNKQLINKYSANSTDMCASNGVMTSSSKGDICELCSGGVISKLKLVQKMDDIDVESLYPMYFKVKEFFDSGSTRRKTSTVDGPYNSELWQQVASQPGPDMLQYKPLDQWSPSDMILKLCKFSVASTAKDCSIMLTFQEVDSPLPHLPFIKKGDVDIIAYCINLVDLDPKEFDRVLKYYKDTCRTVQHYIQNNPPRDLSKTCGGK